MLRTSMPGLTAWSWSVAWALAASACGGPAVWRMLPDPARDDHGPGSYIYPQSTLHRPGAYDLREVRLGRDGADLVVEVRFQRPIPVVGGVRLGADVVADLFLPTVDLYFDHDLLRGRGVVQTLAGRRALLAEDLGWEAVVVLTALPTQARRALPDPPAGATLYIPERVRVRGDRLVARVPADTLGGRDVAQVGIAVAVGSTVFLASFKTLLEEDLETGLLREVTPEPGQCGDWQELADGAPCTFGGCGGCRHHPRILDALHPEPGVQEAALGAHAGGDGSWALLPVVFPEGRHPQGEPPRTARIVAKQGRTATFEVAGAAPPGVRPGALLEALDAAGARVALLAVVSLHPDGIGVATLAEGDLTNAVSVRLPALDQP